MASFRQTYFEPESKQAELEKTVDWIEGAAYKACIESLPIACVDVVLRHKGKFLLVLRTQEPGKGVWWLPGGRIRKGETFLRAGARKIEEEVGLKKWRNPRVLNVAETFFDSSAHGTANTHTINTVIVADADEAALDVVVDANHEEHKWVALDADLSEYKPYVQDSVALANAAGAH